VYGSPARRYKGNMSDGGNADAHPEEYSNDELYVAMQWLFQEKTTFLSPSISIP